LCDSITSNESRMKRFDVIILTDTRYELPENDNWYVAQLLLEERLLGAGLEARGLRVMRVAWTNPHFDWRQTVSAIFRSTWDYADRFDEFSTWMARASAQTRLFNSPRLVRWNVDKHYLIDLAQSGVNVPPTQFIAAGAAVSLRELYMASGWPEVILKPAVSGAARHTYRLAEQVVDGHEMLFRKLVQTESMLLQPFLANVLAQGEVSLIVIDGICMHAVRKTAKPGDFRVQDDHGGNVGPHTLNADEIAFAERAVAACPEPPLYARVDVVRDDSGALSLMELELIEPELFFRFYPPSADALAAAIARSL
jgi:glutathione synthase/RimK-type ligase-like ATP-grasp enzyme